MLYQRRDIVVTSHEYGNRIFVILLEDVENNRYYAVSQKNKKKYWLFEEQIANKIDVVPADSPLLDLDISPREGADYAKKQAAASKSVDEQSRWVYLATLQPGDKIGVIHGKLIYPAEFVQINIHKPVKVFRAKIKGLSHDFSLISLVTLPK